MTSYFHYSDLSMKKQDDNLRRKINILKMDFKMNEDVFYHRVELRSTIRFAKQVQMVCGKL